jgi:hypothetical protein
MSSSLRIIYKIISAINKVVVAKIYSQIRNYIHKYIYIPLLYRATWSIFFFLHMSYIIAHSDTCHNVTRLQERRWEGEQNVYTQLLYTSAKHKAFPSTETRICETPDCGFELLISCCDEGRSRMMTMISLNIYCKLRQQITHTNNIPGHTHAFSLDDDSVVMMMSLLRE